MEITSCRAWAKNEQILAGVATLGFSAPTPVQAAVIPAVLAKGRCCVWRKRGTVKLLMLLRCSALLSRKPGGAEVDAKGAQRERQTKRGRRCDAKRNAAEATPNVTPARAHHHPNTSLRPKSHLMLLKVFARIHWSALSLSPVALVISTRYRAAKGWYAEATPGRLMIFFDKKQPFVINTRLVLDEADRMLDMILGQAFIALWSIRPRRTKRCSSRQRSPRQFLNHRCAAQRSRAH